MSTNSSGPGGPSPFSEEEVASVTQGPAGDPELDELEAATIDATDVETPFEKIVAKARKLSVAQVRNVVESVLFVAPEALSVDQLYESTGIEREKIQKGLEALQGDRREGLSGLVLYEVAGGWQFRTAPESSEFVRRFLKVNLPLRAHAALVPQGPRHRRQLGDAARGAGHAAARDGRAVHVRKATRPEPHHQRISEILGLSPNPGGTHRVLV